MSMQPPPPPSSNASQVELTVWTQQMAYHSKQLDLQIANEKRKEKEAELEILRMRQVNEVASPYTAASPLQSTAPPQQTMDELLFAWLPEQALGQGQREQQQQPTTMWTEPGFDMSMLQGSTINQPANMAYNYDMNTLMQGSTNQGSFSGHTSLPVQGHSALNMQYQPYASTSTLSQATTSTAPPSIKQPPSPSPPPAKGPPSARKKPAEKKKVTETHVACTVCSSSIARILLRAPKSLFPDPVAFNYRCMRCSAVSGIDPGQGQGSSLLPSGLGSLNTRKRMRAVEDEPAEGVDESPGQGRCMCDVCQRMVGSGGVTGPDGEGLGHMAEVICVGCDAKYSRCTDCGGGGGARLGIGKWRAKQLFQLGRKTCSLSHNRLGDRVRELAVHHTPQIFTEKQLEEVLSRCKAMWTEKTLSRLAVPELLELDAPDAQQNALRTYADIESMMARAWPIRESMIKADDVDPRRFRRFLGLTWAHTRSRRGSNAGGMELEAHEEDGGETVLANVKMTNQVIPFGSDLVAMWCGEWDMHHGSLLVSTSIPFEGADGEDSSALSVAEMLTKIQEDREKLNTGRAPADKLPPCEHLWVVSGGMYPLIRERMMDVLIRKRAFAPVDEYLTRHPSFASCFAERPGGLHPDPIQDQGKPLILVRWLGTDFNPQKVYELKKKEFAGNKGKRKAPVKKRAI